MYDETMILLARNIIIENNTLISCNAPSATTTSRAIRRAIRKGLLGETEAAYRRHGRRRNRPKKEKSRGQAERRSKKGIPQGMPFTIRFPTHAVVTDHAPRATCAAGRPSPSMSLCSCGCNESRAPRDLHRRAPFSPTAHQRRIPSRQRRIPFKHDMHQLSQAPQGALSTSSPFHQQHTSSAFRFLSARCCRTLSCPHTARNLPALLRCEEAGCTSQRGQSDRVRPF